jgi:broad specificity phosphatase PhoE
MGGTMFTAALYTEGKIVTGSNHGEAFGKLTECEQNSSLCSGFVDPKKLKFFSDECEFYLKKIIMLRHGDSVGKWNSPLTPLGRNQVSLAAASFTSLTGYTGYCSPLLRCLETAHIVEDICNIHFAVDARLSEKARKESSDSFLDRIKSVLEDLPEKSLLISHCDFIQVMTEIASDASSPEIVPNCSVTYIDNHKAIYVARTQEILL